MKPAVVFVPSPGHGHLVPTVELAKRLNRHHLFSITILTTPLPFSLPSSSSSSGLDDDIHILPLPQVDPPSLDRHSPEAFISILISRHAPNIRNAITSSPTPVVALVVDLFATTLADEVGSELGIPTYLYFTSGAALLALMLHLPALHQKLPGPHAELRDLDSESLHVPGLGQLPPAVLPSPLMNRTVDGYDWFVSHGRRFRTMQGIIVNTFQELEAGLLAAIGRGLCIPDHPTPPVYTVGPVLALDRPEIHQPDHPCIRWLDGQPPASVAFLCFGSMGAMPAEQAREVAVALESSGVRFLWAVRVRKPGRPGPASDPGEEELAELLPEEFLGRTEGRGMVWPRWAPQKAVLGHVAVGGFVSHCGWNSMLESLWFGVPVLAWPIFAEQRLNAFWMAREVGMVVEVVAEEMGDGGDGGGMVVRAEEVERGMRCLMGEKGRMVRARAAAEWREGSRRAVEEGGSSSESLDRLVQRLLQPTCRPTTCTGSER